MILRCQPSVGFLQQGLEAVDPLVASEQFSLCNTRFLLQRRVLVNKLLLNHRELFKVSLQEHHLFLLRLTVAVTDDIAILLFNVVELNFKFDDLKQGVSSRHNRGIFKTAPSHIDFADHASMTFSHRRTRQAAQ